MNEIEICLQNKIANSSKLQPTIFTAILKLYKNGNHQMTAEMVKKECKVIDIAISWNKKLAAICNAMRNTLGCGAVIIGEDRDFNDFTIAFDENNNILDIRKDKLTPKINIGDAETKKNKSPLLKENLSANKKIEERLKFLDWSFVKDKYKPKLLIIGCSDSKQIQPINPENVAHNNYDFGGNLSNARELRMIDYNELLNNPNPANYFNKIRNGQPVNANYFMDVLNDELCYQALDVYGSNNSPFYKPNMKTLYREKIANSNLHLLIISGLYGIIKHNDYIKDYHLEMKKGNNVWGNNILLAVNTYIVNNNIDHDAVFFSLSDDYLNKLNPINPNWTNLWIKGASSANLAYSADFLLNEFLPRL